MSPPAESPIGPAPATAVIIVDHGSRRDEANRMLERFVEAFGAGTDHAIVQPAHMDLVEPSIATAYDRCVQRGARDVVIAPYFLSPGKHSEHDIPALAAAAAARHPGTTYRVCQPIGMHPLMVAIIRDRVGACLDGR